MEQKHTPEPWRTDGGYSWGKQGGQFAVCNDNDALMVTTAVGNDGANARRVVACVNACEGIETDRLEKFLGAETQRSIIRMSGSLAEITRQRDELLAALERLSFAAECRDNTMGDACRLIAVKAELVAANRQAINAIANAKGGTL